MTHIIKFLWGDRRGSNSRQPVPQTGALPTELRSPYFVFFISGVSEEIRTPDPRLRRALLYPAELNTHNGAGSGNRTHLSSLEGWSITDIRYPHILFFNLKRLIGRGDRDRTCDLMVPNHARSHLRHTPVIILFRFATSRSDNDYST